MHVPLLIALVLGGELTAAPPPGDPSGGVARARRPRARPSLVILPGAASPKVVKVAELRRLLGLLLKRSAVRVQIGPAMKAASFPAQVWRARKIGRKRRAMAVVWFRSLSNPTDSNEAELFLHLVDRVTNKALIKTLRLRGRVGFDLHHQVALKLWTLLRASLLELRGTPRARDPVIARLIGRRGGAAARPARPARPATVVRKVYVRPAPTTSRVRLGLGYVAGVFASGLAWHHGAWLGADVILERFDRPRLTLALGASVELLWPVELRSAGVDLRLDLIPACLGLALGWHRGAVTLEGRLRAGALIQKAAASIPGAEGHTYWRGNPLVGAGFAVGWRPSRRLVLELRATADGLVRGQCFQTAADDRLCVDRARFTLGVGLRLVLL